ncbi:MAG: class I SAM-dependent methyltransferase, partial [Stenotrophomonas sp.]
MAYQSFDDQKGDSDSSAKLVKLRFPTEFAGKSFLDIGCNEGFFCLEAINRGATSAVGVDIDPDVLKRATKRAEGKAITYLNASWWNLPEEQFDVIQMSSALHYEPRPKLLMDQIVRRLKPGGVFILEAGLYAKSEQRMFVEVQRHDGSLMFPTRRLLVEDILSQFSVRYIGPSVIQKGDPLERHVFHCFVKRPVALIFSGVSGAGKTYVSQLLATRANLPRFDF